MGFVRAKLSNYFAKKYKGEKKKRNVQNIMGIEQLVEDTSIDDKKGKNPSNEKKVTNMQRTNKFYILYAIEQS